MLFISGWRVSNCTVKVVGSTSKTPFGRSQCPCLRATRHIVRRYKPNLSLSSAALPYILLSEVSVPHQVQMDVSN